MNKWHALLATTILVLIIAANTLYAATPGQPVLFDADEPRLPQTGDSSASDDKKNDKDADKKKDEKEKWNVSAATGLNAEVPIDTQEGTWMNLDVSPQGDEIVFDLLGDIYSIPIAGGEARSLTSGIAWDMQPRYSPDGKFIAFTSDRAGGDNLWVMSRDGSNFEQVTKEDFRLVNSPAWTPDGNYLAGRKHFTGTRSVGAGEIWLYHRGGGDGVQMTKRANDQKDLGEPTFSPDGRYLYFSQDVTPGTTFEYNKDPNTGIYNIKRLDRESGDIDDFVTGPGGAVRPTPSPDGKQLAFVRRVRGQSELFIQDVQSGRLQSLFRGLDRDMQETWAIHGIYPTLAWLPDSKVIVFWSGGKIHRIDIVSKVVTDIPFHIHSTRTVSDAVRFPVKVAPDHFPVKMLRWVEVSPKGNQVVYQALGHLYIRGLPNGTPRRLTAQNDHFEFYPSFSRDGRYIVYSTWDDFKLGSLRIAPATGGEGRLITTEPGHYVEPVFSPDGSKVVYRKTTGGGVVSDMWSRDPGIYGLTVKARNPVKDAKPFRITSKGLEPHFAASNERIYLRHIGEDDRRALIGINLNGGDERTYLTSEAATEFRVSHDEKWLAFREGFNAYIAPFAHVGKSGEIGPKDKSVPIRRVSKNAGEYLRWSTDNTKLNWSLGAELYTQDLKNAFSFVPGAPEKLPEPLETGVNISWDQKTEAPIGSIALIGARIVTMRGDEVIEKGTVIVKENRIIAIGPQTQVPIPGDAKMIDVEGKTILPGLVDVHWHGEQGKGQINPQSNYYNYASLAFGVTTIHDPSADTSLIFAASELAKAGLIVAPHIFSTGTILYGAKGDFKAEIDSLDDAMAALRRLQAVGAFSVKSYNQPRREQRQQIITAARALQMMVVPEGGSLFEHNMTMIVDGHTGIEHALPVGHVYKDVIDLWSQSKTAYTPTLIVGYGGLFGENYWYQHTNVWEDQRLLTFVPRDVVDARARRRTMAPEQEYNHIDIAKGCKVLADAGVHIQLGAHGQREGLGAHWELWMLAQGGMTPLQALRAGTLDGARYLGLDGDIGSIETGKLADMIVLDKNPLDDIRDSDEILYTMVNGRLYDARTMNELGNHSHARKKLYFEQ